jgi:hypothetical protein
LGVRIIGLAGLLSTVCCASVQVDDFDQFDSIPMNRVVPFPSELELEDRAFQILLLPVVSESLDATSFGEPWNWVLEELKVMAEEAGASVVPYASAPMPESMNPSSIRLPDVDYLLAIRFDTYSEASSWKPPFQFLWESTDQVAFQPGTCTNRADIEFHIDLIEEGREADVLETFSLRHSIESKSKNVDQTCELVPGQRSALFEAAIMQSLSCLRTPLDRRLAPRGHVVAHRFAKDLDQHLYRISLGSGQGIEVGEAVEVRREQHAAKPSGEFLRKERVIATGVVTDRIEREAAWVAIDPARSEDEILAGDVVRPVLREGLLLSLSAPDCREILEIR